MKILLKDGLVIDPENNIHENLDILLENNIIAKIGNINSDTTDIDKVIELKGKIVFPGMIDLHTHLREPGFEHKETIQTGCEAAMAGGYAKIVCMANTDPVIDNPSTVEFIKSKASDIPVEVFPAGSVTAGINGKQLSEIGFLADKGVKALSDDGQPVMNGKIMRRAMEYASGFNLPIIDHCEDLDLAGEGVMHEGYISTILGLKPIPAAAEEVMVSRDIILSEFTGAQLHIAHLSTKKGVELLAEGKNGELNITAEVTPHHLILTDEIIKDLNYDPDTKVNPPLRSQEDVEALRKGLKDDIIDVIATDHAPHSYEDKLGDFNSAANGISGLETSISLIYDKLINKDIISWSQTINKMVYNPAKVLDIEIEGIQEQAEANLVVFDQEKDWKIDPQKFKSKGKNTPFKNKKVKGKVILNMIEGKIVYDDRRDKNEVIY